MTQRLSCSGLYVVEHGPYRRNHDLHQYTYAVVEALYRPTKQTMTLTSPGVGHTTDLPHHAGYRGCGKFYLVGFFVAATGIALTVVLAKIAAPERALMFVPSAGESIRALSLQ